LPALESEMSKAGPAFRDDFYGSLRAAGMPAVPEEFSVVPYPQVISHAALADIAGFIRTFDRVTTREAWQTAALREAPAIARQRRSEVCFFSAWDFHLPPEAAPQLIEFNDNGSGFIFAAIINAAYYKAAELAGDKALSAPAGPANFNKRIGDFIQLEATAFFGTRPMDLFLVLDDAESLQHGKFQRELHLICTLLRDRGAQAEIGSPAELRWDGGCLSFKDRAVSFIINRSTDFFWESDNFAALHAAYGERKVYVAPNPFTYATRSDKRLLEWLSQPQWDEQLAITAGERQILSRHVPETHLIRADNLAELTQRKREFVFKPLHGFAGRGVLGSDAVGRTRLRRIMAQGYVAQKLVPKPCLDVLGTNLWTDLRVWAYRGEIFQLSGRASRRSERLDLAPPGGWLPTYAALPAR